MKLTNSELLLTPSIAASFATSGNYAPVRVKVGSDGPISSPTRVPTRTLYELLDGLQLLDPRNLNFCGHLQPIPDSSWGPSGTGNRTI